MLSYILHKFFNFFNFDWNIRGIDIVRGLGWQNVKERYCFLLFCLTYKSLNNLAAYYLSDLFFLRF